MTTGARRDGLDWRCYVAEAIGTAMLVLIGPGAAMVAERTHAFGHAGVALAFGLAVTLIVAAIGPLSGAHVNPAVTLAFWSVRRFPGRAVTPYVVAQSLGAIAGAYALRWVLGPVAHVGATTPALSVGRAFAVEAGFSAMLALVIFGVATDTRVSRTVPPFAIGATVFAGALVTGPLTGGSFNPARSLGPAVAAGVWTAHWLYWAAPIAGMLVAARGYELLRGAAVPTTVPLRVPIGVEGPLDDR
jgi:MIP family channel proteins